MQNRKRDTDVQNRLLGAVGEGEVGMLWESCIETSILSRVKQITSPGWMHETSQIFCNVSNLGLADIFSWLNSIFAFWQRGNCVLHHNNMILIPCITGDVNSITWVRWCFAGILHCKITSFPFIMKYFVTFIPI